MRVDVVVGVYLRSRIHKGRSGGRADEEQVW